MPRTASFSMLIAVVALVGHVPLALAHDYWMLPDSLRAPPASDIPISLWVGDHFVAEEERAFEPGRTVRFTHVHSAGTNDLARSALEGARPIVTLHAGNAGGHLLTMERNLTRIEIAADRFNEYLRHEGLTDPLAERERHHRLQTSGRERYTRYLKLFVQSGDVHDDVYGRVLGHTLELVPGRDPASLHAGDSLPVVVRFRARPLANVQVSLYTRAGSNVTESELRTDRNGRVTFTLARDGVHLLRLVHMVACARCADADWESFWASYVFGTCGADGAIVARDCLGAAAVQRSDIH